MKDLLGGKACPPGVRFYPTDEELFIFYLKRKVMGKSLEPEMISEVDVYRFAPWDLPAMACLKTRDLNWFFFCPRARKYPNGGRANRATECGYWKSTGTDRTVNYHSRPVGKIKTLVFHLGKAPKGERTDWVMHEYRLEDKDLDEKGVPQDSYVICKIYKKSGLGPKNGENYGAHFIEEEWESDDDNAQGGGSGLVEHDNSPDVVVSGLISVVDNSNVAYPVCTPIDAATVAPVASVGSPNIAAAVVGTSSTTDASVDTPNVTAASVESASVVAESMGTFSNIAAAATTSAPASAAPAAPAPTASPAPFPASAPAFIEEDMDRLLSCLTANHEEDIGDIYNGLGDLLSPSAQRDIDWKDLYIEMDDLK